jgi:hypothetical protein
MKGDHPSRQETRPIQSQAVRLPFQAFSSRFLKRTVAATFVTLALVAMTAAVYWSPAWAGYYLFAGSWTVVFLGLTPLIVKAFMFDRRPLRGLAYVAGKIAWLAVAVLVLAHWSRGQASQLLFGTALVAGVTTPLLVILLRALGAMPQRRGLDLGGGSLKNNASEKKISDTPRMEPKP